MQALDKAKPREQVSAESYRLDWFRGLNLLQRKSFRYSNRCSDGANSYRDGDRGRWGGERERTG